MQMIQELSRLLPSVMTAGRGTAINSLEAKIEVIENVTRYVKYLQDHASQNHKCSSDVCDAEVKNKDPTFCCKGLKLTSAEVSREAQRGFRWCIREVNSYLGSIGSSENSDAFKNGSPTRPEHSLTINLVNYLFGRLDALMTESGTLKCVRDVSTSTDDLSNVKRNQTPSPTPPYAPTLLQELLREKESKQQTSMSQQQPSQPKQAQQDNLNPKTSAQVYVIQRRTMTTTASSTSTATSTGTTPTPPIALHNNGEVNNKEPKKEEKMDITPPRTLPDPPPLTPAYLVSAREVNSIPSSQTVTTPVETSARSSPSSTMSPSRKRPSPEPSPTSSSSSGSFVSYKKQFIQRFSDISDISSPNPPQREETPKSSTPHDSIDAQGGKVTPRRSPSSTSSTSYQISNHPLRPPSIVSPLPPLQPLPGVQNSTFTNILSTEGILAKQQEPVKTTRETTATTTTSSSSSSTSKSLQSSSSSNGSHDLILQQQHRDHVLTTGTTGSQQQTRQIRPAAVSISGQMKSKSDVIIDERFIDRRPNVYFVDRPHGIPWNSLSHMSPRHTAWPSSATSGHLMCSVNELAHLQHFTSTLPQHISVNGRGSSGYPYSITEGDAYPNKSSKVASGTERSLYRHYPLERHSFPEGSQLTRSQRDVDRIAHSHIMSHSHPSQLHIPSQQKQQQHVPTSLSSFPHPLSASQISSSPPPPPSIPSSLGRYAGLRHSHLPLSASHGSVHVQPSSPISPSHHSHLGGSFVASTGGLHYPPYPGVRRASDRVIERADYQKGYPIPPTHHSSTCRSQHPAISVYADHVRQSSLPIVDPVGVGGRDTKKVPVVQGPANDVFVGRKIHYVDVE